MTNFPSRWHLFFLVAVVILVISVAPFRLVRADDWPQWHGPNRDNKSNETGLLKEWPANGPSLAWKAKDLGGGFSSVAVAAGRIYTLGDFPDGCHTLALEENGGKQIWSTRVGGKGGDHPGPRCTPSVDGDLVYVIGQFGDVVCLEAATGKEVWRKNLNSDFNGQMMSGWGNSESPLVDGDRLICTPGGPKGTLLALDKKTGETLWRSAEIGDAASYSSAIATVIGGIRQYVQLTDRHVFAVAADTGKLLWAADRKGRTAVVPTPIVAGDLVFVTSGYGVGCNLFKIADGNGDFKATEVYQNKEMVNHHGGAVLVGDNIYGFSDHGHFTCMALKTGEVVWNDKAGTLGKGSLTCADGNLYFRNESGEGTIWLVEASPDGFRDHGHFNPPDRSKSNSWPHPVVSNGKLYLRDQEVLLCYDVKAK
jgi:outer membrane protein assembly factor BamB